MKTKLAVTAAIVALLAVAAVFVALKYELKAESGPQAAAQSAGASGRGAQSTTPATVSLDPVSDAAGVASLPAAAVAERVAPRVIVLPKMTYPSYPPVIGKITDDQREKARQIMRGINDYVKTIDKLDFDLSVSDSLFSFRDMAGHVSSSKMDSWAFEGRMMNKTVGANMMFDSGVGQIVMSDPHGNIEEKDIPADTATQLNHLFWLERLRDEKLADSVEEIKFNQKVEIDDKRTLECTVMKIGTSTLAFESSTGRYMRCDKLEPMGHMTIVFDYDGDSRFPSKITGSCADNDWKTVEEHTNLAIKYKN